ncbi:hypothetical protein GCM10008090_15460 [Arenicella chitinivorans]|uniref:Uncharacterized protein n=1 Tax=Arenicella chitinivorans TaxID=1329800 RepID=A0A918RPM9_9GAMM|nr:hypothetical protein [Arenicella chitinivorans]GHA06702.1 hypothetical protein GCM10008090_15460 [Arenicella chitinivorans]
MKALGLGIGLITLFYSLTLNAASLRATQLPNLEIEGSIAPGSRSRLEGDRVLFATEQFEGDTKVFVYDLKSYQSVDILVVPTPTNYQDNAIYTEVYSDGSVAYIVLDGDLYVSDGTKSGTTLVDQFGVYNTKDGVFNAISKGIVIDGVFYFQYSEEVASNGVFGEYAESPALWRSDGTAAGTWKYSGSDGIWTELGAFAAKNEPGSVYLFRPDSNELWKTNSNRAVIKIGQLGPTTSWSYTYNRGQQFQVVSNSQGHFFCTELDGKLHDNGALWRLSNNDSLQKLADKCVVGALTVVNDQIVYKDATGLWMTTGVAGEERQVFQFANVSNTFGQEQMCVIDNKAHAVLTSNSAHRVVSIGGNGTVSVIKQDSHDPKQRVGLVECLQDQLLVYSSPVNEYAPQPERVTHWLIEPETKAIKRLSSKKALADVYLEGLTTGRAASLGQLCTERFCLLPTWPQTLPAVLDILVN